jgi:hypothetical protein
VRIPSGAEPAARGGIRASLIGIGVVLLLIAAAAGWWLTGRRPQTAPPETRASTGDAPPVPEQAPAPGPVTVTVTRSSGKVTFAWTYDQALTTDTYRLRFADGNVTTSTETKISVTAPASGTVCLSVIVVRTDGSHPTLRFPDPTCG